MTLLVKWLDSGREPKCKPDPKFPTGKDLDAAFGAAAVCRADLPYPARRCGLYVVTCPLCGSSVGCTTAGRPDDPRSIKVACKIGGHA